jgi:hypothetical protein
MCESAGTGRLENSRAAAGARSASFRNAARGSVLTLVGNLQFGCGQVRDRMTLCVCRHQVQRDQPRRGFVGCRALREGGARGQREASH